jgi:quercetin dioxygenase-like cupin family protein
MTRIVDVEQPRRIVTGVQPDGTSYVARCELVEDIDYPLNTPPAPPLDPGRANPSQTGGSTRFFRIWASDRLPIPLPNDGRTPFLGFDATYDETPEALRRSYTFPPPLGVRVAWSRTLPGQPVTPPSRMHFTESTDVVFILGGHLGEILDDGEEILRAGDVFIQNGTHHSHEALIDAPPVIGWVIVGALSTDWTPGIEKLHGVSGPLGGWRPMEKRQKSPLAPWTAVGPEPGTYEGCDREIVDVRQAVRPRRVVTGTNGDGRSYYSRVEEVEPVHLSAHDREPGPVEVHRMWQSDRLPDLLPTDGRTPPLSAAVDPADVPEALRSLPLDPAPLGYVASLDVISPSDKPSVFSRTPSMDVSFVMAGEVTLLLDGGGSVELVPGDVLIQNGTTYAWHNRANQHAVLGVMRVGGSWLTRTQA